MLREGRRGRGEEGRRDSAVVWQQCLVCGAGAVGRLAGSVMALQGRPPIYEAKLGDGVPLGPICQAAAEAAAQMSCSPSRLRFEFLVRARLVG